MTRFALAFALLAAPAWAALDDRTARELTEGEERLEAWDLAGAAEIAARLLARAPDEPAVLRLAGKVDFHRGEYTAAVDKLARAAERYGADDPILVLARAAEKETKGYKRFESEHFSFRTPPGKDELLAPYGLEALEAAYRALAEDFQHEVPEKVVVEVYEDAAGLSRVSQLTIAQIKASGTIALCKWNRLMITSPKALLKGYSWLDTLSHEFVHLVVSQKSRNTVPIWIHEGLAKFTESRWRGAPGQGLSPFSEALLVEAAKPGGRLVTFAEMHPSMALLPTQELAALAFAEVFSAIEWMYNRGGFPVLVKMIVELRAGASDRQAVSRAVGMSFEEFEREWKKSLRERKPRISAEVAQHTEKKLQFKDDEPKGKKTRNEEHGEYAELGGDSRGRKAIHFAHLGELLLARNRPAAAEQEYKKSLDIVGKAAPPRLVRRYARALTLQEKWGEAERALAESLALYEDEPASHQLLGTVYQRTGQLDRAREHFLAANAVDPFDPLVHELLLRVATDRGDEAEKAREERALELLRAPVSEKSLARVKDGFLTVRARPVCKVIIDGEDTRLTTPVEKHTLRPGRHSLRLVNEELDVDHSLTLELEAGQTLVLEPDLTGEGVRGREAR